MHEVLVIFMCCLLKFEYQQVVLQDLFALDLNGLEWNKVVDAGYRPAPSSFHCAVQYQQFMVTYGGRFNDNSHSDQLNVLGVLLEGSE